MVPGYRRTLNIYGPRHSNYGIINNISSFFSKMKYYQAIIDIINFIIFDDEINPISPLELPPQNYLLHI
ncbi:unnamed protein product [Rhizophagus irregularis]|nr:unnamed protein product [Rhizophagus irregularis]